MCNEVTNSPTILGGEHLTRCAVDCPPIMEQESWIPSHKLRDDIDDCIRWLIADLIKAGDTEVLHAFNEFTEVYAGKRDDVSFSGGTD